MISSTQRMRGVSKQNYIVHICKVQNEKWKRRVSDVDSNKKSLIRMHIVIPRETTKKIVKIK